MAGFGTGSGSRIATNTGRVIDPTVNLSNGQIGSNSELRPQAAPPWAPAASGGSTIAGSDTSSTNPTLPSWKGQQVTPGLNYMGRTDNMGNPIGNSISRIASGGGGQGNAPPTSVDNGTISYIPGGTHAFVVPHNVQIDPMTGKIHTSQVGDGGAGDAARQAAAAGQVTGFGLTAEALGLQKNLEAFMNLSTQIRKLGISDATIRAAEKRLAGYFAGDSSYLKDPAFAAQSKFAQDNLQHRLSASGYAPGEQSYGEGVMTQANMSQAMDWSKTWVQQNLDIMGMGNQLGQIGAQGQIAASQDAVNMNPAGLYAAGGVATANAAKDPLAAWNQWLANQGDWTKKFPKLGP